MAASVMRDHAETVLHEEEHLAVPGIGVQRPAMGEGYDWACAPILIVDLRAVFRGDGAHRLGSLRVLELRGVRPHSGGNGLSLRGHAAKPLFEADRAEARVIA